MNSPRRREKREKREKEGESLSAMTAHNGNVKVRLFTAALPLLYCIQQTRLNLLYCTVGYLNERWPSETV